jgi:hypothetical protein
MSTPRRTLLLIVAVLALPFVLASALYLSGWRPAGTVNHGRLITPPQAVPAWEGWQGKWSLAFIHEAPCDRPCFARLDELRRLRLSLAKEAERTQVVPLRKRPGGLPDLPDGSVVLVDPNGLAMLRYGPGADAKGMRADLERLLKYSWTG